MNRGKKISITNSFGKIHLFLMGCCICFSQGYAQQPVKLINRCGTHEVLKRNILEDSIFLRKWKNQQSQLKEYIAGNKRSGDDTTIYSIPVVVHIVHNDGPENLDDSAVYTQIDVLNNDYRRNPGTMGYNNDPVGADTRIVFCLAQKDPNGNATNGILRIKDSTSAFTNDYDSEKYLKKLSYWDATKYLNIWVCNLEGGLLGFGTYPGGDPDMDGVVIHYKAFGTYKNSYSPYNFGRTTTHEVGHYLNLFHPWGDNTGNCDDDDGISDTPACSGEYTADKDSGCKAPLQCGFRRQIENYMDYSDDFCMKMFTKGQTTKMRSAISLYRKNLVSPANINTAGIQQGCGFILSVSPDKIKPESNLFSIFPNPTNGNFTLRKAGNFYDKIIQIKVYDYQGRIINTISNPEFSGENINFSMNEPEGVYFLQIQTGRKNFIIPFIYLKD